MEKPKFKIGDRVTNRNGEYGFVRCVMENGEGGFCYAVGYDFDPTRTFLNREASLREAIT